MRNQKGAKCATCKLHDDDSNNGDDEDCVDCPEIGFNLLNKGVITKNHHHKGYLACVDIRQELVDFNESFLLLGVFDLVGHPKVDSESKISERKQSNATGKKDIDFDDDIDEEGEDAHQG